MEKWHLWQFPLGDVLDDPDEHAVLYADWWGYSLTQIWLQTEGCADCARVEKV